MGKFVRLALLVLIQTLLYPVAQADVRFEVSFDRAVYPESLTGRVVLIITRSERHEPRFQIAPNIAPIFGLDAENHLPSQAAVINQSTPGHSVESLLQLPAGDYYVQAMLNVYSKRQRSDGRNLWAHWNMGGQFFNLSPGNLYSDAQKIRLDPATGSKINLLLNHIIPSVDPPKDTKWIRQADQSVSTLRARRTLPGLAFQINATEVSIVSPEIRKLTW